MQPHERVSAALKSANDQGRTALVPFVTAGFPQTASFAESLIAISQVGDLVEIGVPFSDPMADGMTIQRSSHAAIENGVSLRWIFEQLNAVRDRIAAPLVLMSYLNPLLAFGYEQLAERALDVGVGGFIVPDLPLEESGELGRALDASGLGLIQLVTPATPDERLARLAEASRGFLYAVTMRGVTGAAAGLPADLAAYLDKVRTLSPLPVCAGFGIRSAEDVRNVGAHASGAIVGSALVEVMERGEDPAAFLRSLLGETMKKVTSADSIVLINHYKNILTSEGIDAFLRNEHLGSIVGEMPFQEVWPELWVRSDRDYDRAVQLIDANKTLQESNGKAWRCPSCRETNESQFAVCWNCGTGYA